jgi:glycosyltransferase involved in cell wall biosynthesis
MADLYPNDMLTEVDIVLTPSNCLREMLINSGIDGRRVFCLPDAVETAPSLRKKYVPESLDKHGTTKIVWVGNEGHWPTLDPVRALLASHPSFKTFKLVTISNHPDADIAWQLDRVWDDIMSCDIGVVPVDATKPRSLVKSNNRATMYMALALPVVCTPISSYAEFILHGVNGFLATCESDWVEQLYALRDPALRQTIGEAAFTFAHAEFSRGMIASKLIYILKKFRSC